MDTSRLSGLFARCDTGTWKQAGKHVSYRFECDEDELTIFFQGSCEPIDWFRNFMFAKRPYKDMKEPYRVHGGFLKAWKEVEDIVRAEIKDETIKHITIVGYSHGGALCAFCHECVWFDRPDLRSSIDGYAFEAPRIYAGFKVKKSLLPRWERLYIIRNDMDIVTHLPPIAFGFCHVGNILHVGKGEFYGFIKSHMQKNVSKSLENL